MWTCIGDTLAISGLATKAYATWSRVHRTLLNRGYCLEMDGQLGAALADYRAACERGHRMACGKAAGLGTE